MLVFVVFVFVFQYWAKRLAGKNVSETTYFVSVGRKTLTQSINQIESIMPNIQVLGHLIQKLLPWHADGYTHYNVISEMVSRCHSVKPGPH